MDCEKFETTVLDELYGELDEVTSAAAKRHVAGCARCSSVLSGLRATRRLAVLPVVDPPADLEERILAAAKEAQKVVPIGRRMSNFVSLAGSWAMRPQTAMAGLFLLMIGSSALFLRGRNSHAPSSMQVSEQGEPVASVMTETVDRPPADKGGIAGDVNAKAVAAAPSPLATAAPPAAASAAAAPGPLDALGGLASRAAPRGRSGDWDLRAKDMKDMEIGGGAGGAPASPPPAAHYGTGNAYSTPASAPVAPPPANAPAPQFAQAPMKSTGDGAQTQQAVSDFDDAMNSYNDGDYATATQRFDVVAKRGDLNAALWEARSIHRASGAAAAAPMFDRVAQQAGASAIGYDAMFDAARCYRELGQIDAARQRLNQLLLVPSYINRAQAELSAMNPKAAAKARPAQPPQAAPAAPASSAGAY